MTPVLFQSSPDPKVGCHPDLVAAKGVAQEPVSILTRPEGRVPPRLWFPRARHPTVFQSSPDPKVGCHLASLPALRSVEPVSILTRPEGRVPLYKMLDTAAVPQVSILTRPEGRVPLVRPLPTPTFVTVFQSSPDPKVGCHPAAYTDKLDLLTLFQSSPDPKVGCHLSAFG